jgi:hypothetical protein
MKLADNVLDDQLVALPILRELLDSVTYRIILSTIDNAKTVSQICHDENIRVPHTKRRSC